MGFLKKIFKRRPRADMLHLPSGSVTVDRNGDIVTSTVSSVYPPELLRGLGLDILALLKEARDAQMPMAEVSIHFSSLRITARELRGGAIIFLFPQTALSSMPN